MHNTHGNPIRLVAVTLLLVAGSVREASAAAPFRAPAGQPAEHVEGMLWLEAEAFEEYGDWKLDTQFTHKMGSAYLICPGLDRPTSKPARTKVRVPRAGKWRAWVRTKDWLPEFSPGKFALEVSGRRGATMGASGKSGWRWESAGDFELQPGDAEVSLVDLSGAYARCDAVLFSSDPAFVPPDEADALESARARLSGAAADIADGGDYGLVVVGAGPGGMGAALSAARLGVQVALVHDRPVLGGNGSKEIGIGLDGAALSSGGSRETGIAEEVRMLARREGKHIGDVYAKLAAACSAKLKVFGNERVMSVEKDGSRITAVIARNTLDGRRTRYRARYFADATGDGWLAHFAGAATMRGREGKTAFGEDWIAPEKPDGLMMSGFVGYGLKRVPSGKAPDYSAPVWARGAIAKGFNRKVDSLSAPWWLENHGRFDELEDPEAARDNLIRISFAYWDWMRNEWQGRGEAASYELKPPPINLGRREGMRVVGDYVLTAKDCRDGRVFHDAVAVGGWSLDTHDPLGMENPGGDGWWHTHNGVPPYTIPFRSLYSKDVENLFLSSRCLSATHWALGSARVQGTLLGVGQACGTAAALCARRALMPREYGRRHIAELQRVLRRCDQTIPGHPDNDPYNLALGATTDATGLVDGVAVPEYVKGEKPRVSNGHSWVSEPGLPKSASLSWKEPVELTEVQIVFDTHLSTLVVPEPMPAELVRDYKLEAQRGGKWKTIAAEKNNAMRFRRHRMPSGQPVSALRVTVTATWGAKEARIYEIRAYGRTPLSQDVREDGRRLVWSEEFNGSELDATKWRFWASMNSTDCMYANDERTVRVADGRLRLRVDNSGDPQKPFVLARGLGTRDIMSFRYGYLEMRGRVPYRHGAWPSFWMQSEQKRRKAQWMSEIDIFEVFSSKSAAVANLHKWSGAKHSMMPGGEGSVKRAYEFADSSRLNEEFHVYAMEWTPETISFYVDDECYVTVPIDEAHDFAPKPMPGMLGFHDPHYIIINNEVFTPGHGWCPEEKRLMPGEPMPIDYEVDWVRLWQRDGEEIFFSGSSGGQ